LITRKSIVTFGFLGASSMLIALTALAGPASAQVSPPTGSSESPNPVQTSAQFGPASTGTLYQGDAGIVSIVLPANSVLTKNATFKVEECNTGANSQANCDIATLQTVNASTEAPLKAGTTGAASFAVDLWVLPTGNATEAPDVNDPNNNNPPGFDPASTVTCWNNQPCALWVGDSTANWSEGYLFDSLTPLTNTTALPPPPTTTTTAATTTTTGATTTTTGATTTTTGATTTTTGATTTTTGATTTSVGTTTTTVPTQGQVPESPYVPLLPIGAAGIAGAAFLLYRFRRHQAHNG
jgi:hypothetical protein